MAIFHVPLLLNKKIFFYKLMGSGKNGTFDIRPDLQQWAIMLFWKAETPIDASQVDEILIPFTGKFIWGWLKLWCTKINVFQLQPYSGHGSWDGESFLEQRTKAEDPSGPIAVLTRATIRLRRLIHFWRAVPSTAIDLTQNDGFVYSIGIGEVPFIKQATFSIWESAEKMKTFAYKKAAHQKVIQHTRKENWYAEELFLRFHVLTQHEHKS